MTTTADISLNEERLILKSFGYRELQDGNAMAKPVAKHLLCYNFETKKILNLFNVTNEDDDSCHRTLIYNSAILCTETKEAFKYSLCEYETNTRYNVGSNRNKQLINFLTIGELLDL